MNRKFILVSLFILLSGCGQSGRLYMPAKNDAAANIPTSLITAPTPHARSNGDLS